MDAINFLLVRYGDLHRGLIGDLLGKLPEAQVRGRPHPGVNTVAWLLWHTARVEDVGVNRFIADRPQVLEDRWLDRLGVPRRDVGTGMNDAEVDDLSARIDLQALRGHWEGVVSSEGAVAARAEWLTDFWAAGRSRAWFLAQVPLLHVYGHHFEARVAAGLWEARSL